MKNTSYRIIPEVEYRITLRWLKENGLYKSYMRNITACGGFMDDNLNIRHHKWKDVKKILIDNINKYKDRYYMIGKVFSWNDSFEGFTVWCDIYKRFTEETHPRQYPRNILIEKYGNLYD